MRYKQNTNQIDTKHREFKKQDQYLGHPLESLHEMELEMLEDEVEKVMCIANYDKYRDGEQIKLVLTL